MSHPTAVIGIAGVTVPGALDCLSRMHRHAGQYFDHHHHPRFVLDQPDFGIVHAAQVDNRWDIVTDSIVGSLQRLAEAGAQLAVIPANTVHRCIDDIRARSPLPVLSMLDVVAEACRQRGLAKVGILGTAWTMSGHLYRQPLSALGLEEAIPSPAAQERIQRAIFEELVPTGACSAQTLADLLRIVQDLRDAGCDGVALACTELPLVLNDDNCGLPAIDTTRLLAEAAVNAVCERK